MKRKEPRWYRLWYYTAAMWLITFCGNLSRKEELGWVIVVQFLNIIVSFGAGVVNARRYKKSIVMKTESKEKKDTVQTTVSFTAFIGPV